MYLPISSINSASVSSNVGHRTKKLPGFSTWLTTPVSHSPDGKVVSTKGMPAAAADSMWFSFTTGCSFTCDVTEDAIGSALFGLESALEGEKYKVYR